MLLKNDGVLPLSRDLRTIAVIGPNADEVMTLLGNYYGTPATPGDRPGRDPQRGRRRRRRCSTRAAPTSSRAGRTRARCPPSPPPTCAPPDGVAEPGLRGEYFHGRDLQGRADADARRPDGRLPLGPRRRRPPTSSRAASCRPSARLPNDDFSVRWTGQLLPPVTGRYELTVTGDDGFRLDVDGRRVIDEWTTTPARPRAQRRRSTWRRARPTTCALEYFESIRDAEIRLAWRPPGAKEPFEEALEAARAADAVVFVGGLTGDVEGEEMTVSYPGFAGGDRTDLALPGAAGQAAARAARHRQAGRARADDRLRRSPSSGRSRTCPRSCSPGIPGQQGGNAVADVLFGDVNPSGRLPVTFYRSVDQLPPFADYDMKGQTYRYFAGDPLYPFGHGLSYTRFEYSGPRGSTRRAWPRTSRWPSRVQRQERRLAAGRRGGAALRARGGAQGADAAQGAARLRARDPCSRASSGASPSA